MTTTTNTPAADNDSTDNETLMTGTTNPCRLCGNEINKGRGNYRNSDGLVCFNCIKTMTPAQKEAA